MKLPLAIVKARIRNWEIIAENRPDIRWCSGGIVGNRIRYYEKLHRKLELEQFFNVKLPDA